MEWNTYISIIPNSFKLETTQIPNRCRMETGVFIQQNTIQHRTQKPYNYMHDTLVNLPDTTLKEKKLRRKYESIVLT